MERYTADLHTHTSFSDGANTPDEMFKSAQKVGLSVLAITDHNTVAGIRNLNSAMVWEKYNVHLIPGFELSLANGHFVILGMPYSSVDIIVEKYAIRGLSRSLTYLPKQTIKDILRYFLDHGSAVIVTHPCIPFVGISVDWRFLIELNNEKLIHGAEAENYQFVKRAGRLYPFWQKSVSWLYKREGIKAFSNSDAHRIEDVAGRRNVFWGTDPAMTLEKIKSGE
jgi:predicted metal-dependent phosphoesterase TrpH